MLRCVVFVGMLCWRGLRLARGCKRLVPANGSFSDSQLKGCAYHACRSFAAPGPAFGMEDIYNMSRAPPTTREEEDRMYRLKLAVLMVSRGDSQGRKVSVRRAAAQFGVPKSTVHRHIQVNRGVEPQRRGRTSGTSSRRIQRPVSHKLDIGFLVHHDCGA
eukprot:IDg20431t1